MRKLIGCILILMITITMLVPAYGGEYDLSTMDVEELLSLNKQISEELIRRNEYKALLTDYGVYKMSEAISIGRYEVKNIARSGRVELLLYETEADVYEEKWIERIYLNGEERKFVYLEPGYVLVLNTPGNVELNPLYVNTL